MRKNWIMYAVIYFAGALTGGGVIAYIKKFTSKTTTGGTSASTGASS